MPDQFTQRVLVVVAHPDDETIFMGGLINRLRSSGCMVDIACATAATTASSSRCRYEEFLAACGALGAHPFAFDLPDHAGPLPVQELELRLLQLRREYDYLRAYTHGIWGEYGHRHHQDVSLAVHRAFGSITRSLAGPLHFGERLLLTSQETERKRSIVRHCYASQPSVESWCTSEECFVRLHLASVEAMIAIAAGVPDCRLAERMDDGGFRSLLALSLAAFRADAAPFPEVAHIPSAIWRRNYQRFAARLAAIQARWN
ncbi:PIG-L deacetylase family protein [Pseudoduganella sp. HUAS MS19]